ncbi:hypothetical protein CFIMG_004164RAa [Ceratocystis fimbriata CBS 114723]|uniref:Uncharacterized protein n=1 Tax=Ceratocystis fimbriata CBS 114723 TaxID=1035309 RepID=A0A2C5X1G9_9PEZI|nr:hypothetical protein CFIMG_004164RAa [Ceratocystis fimbriata CBS 114723]
MDPPFRKKSNPLMMLMSNWGTKATFCFRGLGVIALAQLVSQTRRIVSIFALSILVLPVL